MEMELAPVLRSVLQATKEAIEAVGGPKDLAVPKIIEGTRSTLLRLVTYARPGYLIEIKNESGGRVLTVGPDSITWGSRAQSAKITKAAIDNIQDDSKAMQFIKALFNDPNHIVAARRVTR